MNCKLKKGMTVIVIAGRSRGKQGRILRIDLDSNRVVVEGVNMVKRHSRASKQNPQGGIIERESTLHISNVAAIDPDTKAPVRIRMQVTGDRKVRVSHRSGKSVE